MSGLQLTIPLVEDVLNTIIKHDPQADDHGMAMQYMAAITGFLLGHQDFNEHQRTEFLNQLQAFSQQVCNDIVAQRAEREAPPPAQDAFGVWKPGDQ
jgi:hypothetical protein